MSAQMDHQAAVQKLAEKIKDIPFAMLTTACADGTLRSRPMTAQQVGFDGTLWFFTGASTHKTDEIAHDRHVNVSFSKPEDNVYVSVSGNSGTSTSAPTNNSVAYGGRGERHRIPVEQESRGTTVNIASLLSFQGGILAPPTPPPNPASAGMTRTMAIEWASKGISAIAPGYIATGNTSLLRNDPARNKSFLERIPAGRWGEPSDLGGMAVFLACPLFSHTAADLAP